VEGHQAREPLRTPGTWAPSSHIGSSEGPEPCTSLRRVHFDRTPANILGFYNFGSRTFRAPIVGASKRAPEPRAYLGRVHFDRPQPMRCFFFTRLTQVLVPIIQLKGALSFSRSRSVALKFQFRETPLKDRLVSKVPFCSGVAVGFRCVERGSS